MNSAKKKVAPVAFCADRLMEVPLHVAASSLLRHLDSSYEAKFYFLLDGFSTTDIKHLKETLDRTGTNYSFQLLKSNEVGIFRGFRPLHGNLVTYYRLLLPELISEDRLPYIDCDTYTGLDISPLFETDLGPKPCGFVVDGTVASSLENEFFIRLGKDPAGPAFNAGVMLFNLPEWRKQDCLGRLLSFCKQHASELMSADQTALNALFGDDCYHLDPRFNLKVYGISAVNYQPSAIIHFVGSPKPWDIAGSYFTGHSSAWFAALRNTSLPFYKKISIFNIGSWVRLPRILGGYARTLKRLRLKKS